MKYEKCPTCGNEQLLIAVEDVIRTIYSAKTGRVIRKDGCIHINCWTYSCRCGWFEIPEQAYDSVPDIIRAKRKNV